MQTKKLIGVSEAARLASVSRQTIGSWIKSAWLTVERVGRPDGYKGQPMILLDQSEVIAVARERGTINGDGPEMQSV